MIDEDSNKTTTSPTAPVDSSAETTLTKDGDLGINKLADASTKVDDMMNVSKPAEPVSTGGVDFTPPPSSQPVPAVDGDKPEPLISTAEAGEKTGSPVVDSKPVTISPQESTAADGIGVGSPSPEEQLSDQVETLTGEIQALESKIERLTPGATEAKNEPPQPPMTPTPPMPPSNPDIAMPPMPSAPAPAAEPDMTLPGEATKKEEKPEVVEKPAEKASSKPEDKSAVATFSDIFSKAEPHKSDKKADAMPAAAPAKLMPDAPPEAAPSGVAVIGEVLAFFGILVLAVLLFGPFYKTMIGDSLNSMIKAVGWLVAPTSLLLSFILLMFAKGKGLLKTAVFILLIISVVFYLGINTTGTISEQLNNYLGTLFSAFK